jgi:RNA polymerase sigma factor (sigma-70 family)
MPLMATSPDMEPTVVDRAGTPDLWDRAFRQHARRVVVSLLAMGLSLEEAEEIANRAWARIFEQVRAEKLERVELPGLVIRQARFFALDVHRRTAKDDAARRSVEHTPDPAADPEQRLLSKQQLARAAEVIGAMNEKSQDVFRIVYQNPSMPHAEVARTVELSVQRVRQILWEVRRAVRTALEEKEEA